MYKPTVLHLFYSIEKNNEIIPLITNWLYKSIRLRQEPHSANVNKLTKNKLAFLSYSKFNNLHNTHFILSTKSYISSYPQLLINREKDIKTDI